MTLVTPMACTSLTFFGLPTPAAGTIDLNANITPIPYGIHMECAEDLRHMLLHDRPVPVLQASAHRRYQICTGLGTLVLCLLCLLAGGKSPGMVSASTSTGCPGTVSASASTRFHRYSFCSASNARWFINNVHATFPPDGNNVRGNLVQLLPLSIANGA
eukprot:88435-Amphidinium_carterae.1